MAGADVVQASVFDRVGATISYRAWAQGGGRSSLPSEAEDRPRRLFHRRLRRLQLGRELRAHARETGREAVDRRMAPGMAVRRSDLVPGRQQPASAGRVTLRVSAKASA